MFLDTVMRFELVRVGNDWAIVIYYKTLNGKMYQSQGMVDLSLPLGGTLEKIIPLARESFENLMRQDTLKEQKIEEDEIMTKLTTKARAKLPKTAFAEPGKRKFPVNDKAHARNAKARASEMEHKGKISQATKAKIDAKANKVLGKGKKKTLKAKNV